MLRRDASFVHSVLFATALLLLFNINLDVVRASGSFQSGRLNGAVYSGGMSYNHNFMYITGITYGTNGDSRSNEAQCFVAKFKSKKLQMHNETISKAIGDGELMQSCSAISVYRDFDHPDKPVDQLVVVGASDPGGEYGRRNQPSGFVLALKEEDASHFSVEVSSPNGKKDLMSIPVNVKYVRESVEDGILDGSVYVASVTSKSLNENPSNIELLLQSENQPNWITHYKYGSSFELTLEKFKTSGGVGSYIEKSREWIRNYPLDVGENSIEHNVEVTGMIHKRWNNHNWLIVVGSTSGSGAAYGPKQPGSEDIDGFISVFRGENGHLRANGSDNGPVVDNKRIGTDKTDLILGICHDRNDPHHFYIVGATEAEAGMGDEIETLTAVKSTSEGSLHGFVQKITLKSLEAVWKKTWGANWGVNTKGRPSSTAGVDCAVAGDGTMYVAGVVNDGAQVQWSKNTEHSGNNIVAMKLGIEAGDVKWITQFGSSDGDENLARSESVGLDKSGNMVILGDTTGSLFRKRDDNTDNDSNIFLTTLSEKDGSHDTIVPANHPGKWNFGKGDKPPAIGMLSGGKWKDSEVYDTAKWHDPNAIGIQSGPTSGSVFAGGMVYDEKKDTVYLTGIAYEGDNSDNSNVLSSCMVTKVPLKANGYNGWAGATGKIIGEKNVLEVCDSIALHGYGEVVAIGSADKGSTLQNGDYPMAGFAIALDRFDLEEIDATALVTKDPNTRIQYPIDIVSDGNDLYIVSLTSTDSETTREFKQLMANGGKSAFSPNWINMKKYGSSFDMTVSKVTLETQMIDGVSTGKILFSNRWSKEFPIRPDSNGGLPRVFLGGAILKKSKGYLAVSGSTRGKGRVYGAASGNDEDGFVTLLDMNTGALAGSVDRNKMREGTAEDDTVLGMCHNPYDESSFYLVGGTKGKIAKEGITETPDGSTHAMVLKIDASTLTTTWAVQFGALRNGNSNDTYESLAVTVAKALDCAVVGESIYVGGIVDDNAGIVLKKKTYTSKGGDDIWVAKLSTIDGQVDWGRQQGSEGNDHIAPRGGITVNSKGSVLVFGDTNGEFYREHLGTTNKKSELFLMEINSNGSYKPHVKHHKAQTTAAPVSAPASAPGSAPAPGTSPQSTPPPFLVNSSEDKKMSRALLAILVVVCCLAVIALIAFLIFHYSPKFGGILKRSSGSKFEVKDGIVNVDKGKSLPPPPPPSSFKNMQENNSDSFKANVNDII